MSNQPTQPIPANPHRFSLEDIQEASESYDGFCLACGEIQGQVEPDARGYDCESCDEPQVYGADEIVIMGLVD